MITLSGVKKIFRTKNGEVTALGGVDLEITEGDIFGIIGYSGAGKSTLIRTINLLERPTAGEVTIAGKPMSHLKGKALRAERKNIGMIFQHFNLLWSRTVKENISFPLEIAGVPKRIREKRVAELIHLVGLDGKADAYPNELSGGQKQRVGIARAMANHPKVLLCDEPTSALDPKTTDAILELLSDINRSLGITIVMITHDMDVIRKICRHVAVLDGGRIVEQSTVADVFSDPKAAITKEFVKQIDRRSDARLHKRLGEEKQTVQVSITFTGVPGEHEVINDWIREDGLAIRFLNADLDDTRADGEGTLSVALFGQESQIKRALHRLDELNLHAEVRRDAAHAVS
ncbi:methionine ABC transporter ATP-binding protein [Camelliibacillus cellulosilyticus]|uniref:Methionine ABC transporter ATP-binding protein n=1 Tax=Camelliibacillus cellulosilyticus TaxID=2174486 RepID=A0ABV9GP34_9BACL